MIFKKLKNIDTAFQLVRGFCAVMVTGSLLLSCFAIFETYRVMHESKERIYVIADGKIAAAISDERKDNIVIEAKDHIRTFHQYFFSLDPDEKVIQANITKALYLADVSAKRAYDNLKESDYYSNIISGNVTQAISVDSIEIDTKAYPFYWRCFATEKITRATSITTRVLVTEGYLRSISRSDNNPHGFLIERWNTIKNSDIKMEAR